MSDSESIFPDYLVAVKVKMDFVRIRNGHVITVHVAKETVGVARSINLHSFKNNALKRINILKTPWRKIHRNT